MKLFLTSSFKNYKYEADGSRTLLPLSDNNLFVTNLKKHLTKTENALVIENNPDEVNFESTEGYFKSLEMCGLHFKNKNILYRKTIKQSKKLIESADLIILPGGGLMCQLEFFKQIKLAELLKNYKGVVAGASAGSMNLCDDVFDFPESFSQLNEPRWLKGLGFVPLVLIPHFNGANKTYQIPCETNVVKDYILPMSKQREMLGLPDGSYVLVNEEGNRLYGTAYKIENGSITKIQ